MKKKRLDWCKKYNDMDQTFWENTIFSDETYIEVNHRLSRNRVRRFSHEGRLNDRFLNTRPKYPAKVMVWSCFSSRGTGRVHICNDTMNSDRYINVLQQKLLPTIEDHGLINPNFVDDSAPCHRSKAVNRWKAQNQINQLEWPGNSPDLNPIENLWAILKEKVRKRASPDKITLIENIIDIWNNEISKDLLQNLTNSMKSRIELVIKNKGGAIDY